jgi:hypothetical protein
LSSLQLLLHGLDTGKLLCHSVGEVVKTLRRILDEMEFDIFALGKIESRFLLSYGRFDVVIRT